MRPCSRQKTPFPSAAPALFTTCGTQKVRHPEALPPCNFLCTAAAASVPSCWPGQLRHHKRVTKEKECDAKAAQATRTEALRECFAIKELCDLRRGRKKKDPFFEEERRQDGRCGGTKTVPIRVSKTEKKRATVSPFHSLLNFSNITFHARIFGSNFSHGEYSIWLRLTRCRVTLLRPQ